MNWSTLWIGLKCLFLVTALPCFCASTLSAQIDPIVGKSKGVNIYIDATDVNLQRTAQRMFQLHGGIQVRPTAQAGVLAVQLQALPGQQIAYRITGMGGAPITGVATGRNQSDALLKAGDQIVRYLTGKPGFFEGKIVFVGQMHGNDAKELFETNLLFDQTRKLTNYRSTVRTPRWSPDGRNILFTTFHRSGFPDLFKIDMSTMQVTPFATFTGVNQAARYSPDGSQVALSLSSPGNAEIFVGPATGRNLKRLTRSSAAETSPTWSPDGKQLIFVSDQSGFPQLYQIPAAGGNMTRVPTNISKNCTEPDWNPVYPNKICFTIAETSAQGGRFAIAVYDTTTRKSQVVSKSPHDAVEPRWLPDGRHILHTARSANYSRLVVLDTETGRTTPITTDQFGKALQPDFVHP
jgi:TolB protein